ncbi:hypothetical protein [Qipengyuania sp. MTN3-11]|uniref:hypothetical protein n=1 Tax=Qipengyuania sp. MTN3-11 TaxID=3056557 RepID=UPI0036F1EFD6
MRKSILSASAAMAVLALAACAEPAEDTDAATDTEMTDTAADTAMTDSDTLLDASTATADELVAAGLTQDIADAIVGGQPYDSVVALNAVLPEGEAASILERVFVPINLNTASEEEIRLVPGMTDEMVHEFEEYRPYEDMAEFDREIGKYVDEAEVARFRRYVTL